MSTATICLAPFCPNYYMRQSSLSIPENYEPFRKVESFQNSIDGLNLNDQFFQLSEFYSEYSKENWDGYGAQPVSFNTISEAIKVLNILPSSIPLPEICMEPSGDIGFEWRTGKNMVFVISLSGDNVITYAGIFIKNKVHGSEYFGEILPHTIIENLQRLYR